MQHKSLLYKLKHFTFAEILVMKYNLIASLEEFEVLVEENFALLLYFSRETCAVGEALEPKVIKMLEESYPKIPFYFVDMDKTPDIAAKYQVFIEPTIVVLFDKKETVRKTRVVSIPELSESLARLYQIAFE